MKSLMCLSSPGGVCCVHYWVMLRQYMVGMVGEIIQMRSPESQSCDLARLVIARMYDCNVIHVKATQTDQDSET